MEPSAGVAGISRGILGAADHNSNAHFEIDISWAIIFFAVHAVPPRLGNRPKNDLLAGEKGLLFRVVVLHYFTIQPMQEAADTARDRVWNDGDTGVGKVLMDIDFVSRIDFAVAIRICTIRQFHSNLPPITDRF